MQNCGKGQPVRRNQPSLDVADDLVAAAANPFLLSRPEMQALLRRAAEEIQLLRLALSDAMTRDRDSGDDPS